MNTDPNKKVELDKELIIKADEYFDFHDYEKALDEYIQLVGKIKSKEVQAYIKHQQGICHYHLASNSNDKKEYYLKNSVDNYLKAIQIAGDISPHFFFMNLGLAYSKLASIRNAVEYLKKSNEAQKKALEKCDKTAFLDDYFDIKNKLATTYLDMAEHENIKGNVNTAMKIFKEILKQDEISPSLEWAIFNNVGLCYQRLASVNQDDEAKEYYLDAIKSYCKALKFVDMVNAIDDYILVRNNQGNAYLNYSQLTDGIEEVENAIRCFNEVYEISKKDTKSHEYCRVVNNLGLCYFQLYKKKHCKGDLKKAIKYYKESLEYKEISKLPIMHGNTQMNYGISLFHLSKLENKEQNLDDAIVAFNWSISLSPNPNSYVNQAAHVERSKAFIYKGLLKDDVRCFYIAVDDLKSLIERVEEIDFESYSLHHRFFEKLTNAYNSLSKVEENKSKLISTFKEGLEFFLRYNYKWGIACLNHRLGVVYRYLCKVDSFSDLTNLNNAVNYFETAFNCYKDIQEDYYTCTVLFSLAVTYAEFFDAEDEIEYLEKAKETCEEALKNIIQLLSEDDSQQNRELHKDIQILLSSIEEYYGK
ncbi:hypothetical protein COJ86_05180 [Bacillus cereus]|nr:hypothetical protein COJ86_05180 [Bacillus cereus]